MMSTDLVSLSVARRKQLNDQVTPYKIALLVVIDEHFQATARYKKGHSTTRYDSSEELAFLMTLLELLQVSS